MGLFSFFPPISQGFSAPEEGTWQRLQCCSAPSCAGTCTKHLHAARLQGCGGTEHPSPTPPQPRLISSKGFFFYLNISSPVQIYGVSGNYSTLPAPMLRAVLHLAGAPLCIHYSVHTHTHRAGIWAGLTSSCPVFPAKQRRWCCDRVGHSTAARRIPWPPIPWAIGCHLPSFSHALGEMEVTAVMDGCSSNPASPARDDLHTLHSSLPKATPTPAVLHRLGAELPAALLSAQLLHSASSFCTGEPVAMHRPVHPLVHVPMHPSCASYQPRKHCWALQRDEPVICTTEQSSVLLSECCNQLSAGSCLLPARQKHIWRMHKENAWAHAPGDAQDNAWPYAQGDAQKDAWPYAPGDAQEDPQPWNHCSKRLDVRHSLLQGH